MGVRNYFGRSECCNKKPTFLGNRECQLELICNPFFIQGQQGEPGPPGPQGKQGPVVSIFYP